MTAINNGIAGISFLNPRIGRSPLWTDVNVEHGCGLASGCSTILVEYNWPNILSSCRRRAPLAGQAVRTAKVEPRRIASANVAMRQADAAPCPCRRHRTGVE